MVYIIICNYVIIIDIVFYINTMKTNTNKTLNILSFIASDAIGTV